MGAKSIICGLTIANLGKNVTKNTFLAPFYCCVNFSKFYAKIML